MSVDGDKIGTGEMVYLADAEREIRGKIEYIEEMEKHWIIFAVRDDNTSNSAQLQVPYHLTHVGIIAMAYHFIMYHRLKNTISSLPQQIPGTGLSFADKKRIRREMV